MDAITVFDQRPTHRPRPDWLVLAEDCERDAWRVHDEAADAYLDTPMDAPKEELADKHSAMIEAERQVKEAAAYALMCRDFYSQGKTPALIDTPDNEIKRIVAEARARE